MGLNDLQIFWPVLSRKQGAKGVLLIPSLFQHWGRFLCVVQVLKRYPDHIQFGPTTGAEFIPV